MGNDSNRVMCFKIELQQSKRNNQRHKFESGSDK